MALVTMAMLSLVAVASASDDDDDDDDDGQIGEFEFETAGTSRFDDGASDPPLIVFATAGQGRGELGAFTQSGDVSVVLNGGPPGVCDSETEFVSDDIVQFRGVSTYRDFSQLLLLGTDGFQCVSLDGNRVRGVVNGRVVGGTGEFEGSTGTFELSFTGRGFPLSPGLTAVSAEGTIRLE